MFIVECELNGESRTMTFNTEVKFLDFYSEKSIEVLRGKMDSMKITKINRYVDGNLLPHIIQADSRGMRLKEINSGGSK